MVAQILAINFHEAEYIQAAQRNWYFFFFPDDYNFEEPVAFTFTVEDGVGALGRAVANYYAMNDLSTDVFLYEGGNGSVAPDPTLRVTSYTDIASLFNPDVLFSPATHTLEYTLNASWLGPLDPSDGGFPAQRAFFHSLVTMTLSLPPIRNFAFGPFYRNCYVWGVSVTYDFSDRGHLELSLGHDVLGTCDVYASFGAALADKLLWVNALVVALSVVHSVLLLRAIAKAVRLMMRLQAWGAAQAEALRGGGGGKDAYTPLAPAGVSAAGPPTPDLGAESRGIRLSDMARQPRYAGGPGPSGSSSMDSGDGGQGGGGGADEPLLKRKPLPPPAPPGDVMADGGDGEGEVPSPSDQPPPLDTSWTAIGWREWARLINGWAVLALAANAMNIVSACMNMAGRTAGVPTDFWHALAMGGGVALLWLGVVRYVEHDRAYFNLILTLRRAAPRVLRFLVGVLPVFLGYSFFAVLMWGDRVPRFADPRTAFITLFANLNGDVVRETFMTLVNVHPITGQLFFYSFIALHIYVVLNIVIAVVEESYFITIAKTADMAERAEEEGDRARDAEAAARTLMAEAAAQQQQHQQQHQSGQAGGGAGGGVAGVGLPRGMSNAAMLFSSGVFDGVGEAGTHTAATPGSGVQQHDGSSVQGSGGAPALAAIAPKTDSHSLKQRVPGSGGSRLATLLRLSEWDEVLTGSRIGSSSSSSSGGAGVSSTGSTNGSEGGGDGMVTPSSSTGSGVGGRGGRPPTAGGGHFTPLGRGASAAALLGSGGGGGGIVLAGASPARQPPPPPPPPPTSS